MTQKNKKNFYSTDLSYIEDVTPPYWNPLPLFRVRPGSSYVIVEPLAGADWFAGVGRHVSDTTKYRSMSYNTQYVYYLYCVSR